MERIAVGRAEGVGTEVVGIDPRAGRAVGDGDDIRPEIKNLVERHGDARALGADGVKETAVDAAQDAARVRVTEAGLGAPDRAVVPPRERGHVGAVVAGLADVDQLERAGTGEAAGRGRGEIAGIYAVHVEHNRARHVGKVGRGVLKRKREPVGGRELVVDSEAEGTACAILGVVGHLHRSEVGPVGRGVGKRHAVGRGAGAAPGVDDLVLVEVVLRAAGGDGEAEAIVDRTDVNEIETRVHLARGFLPRAGRLFEIAGVVAHQHVGAHREAGPGALKRAARNHVHRTGEGGTLRLGRR